ncbi:MAG: DUF975 family protein [Butyrivibrio sp.]|nr:DUF975 family protein [Butyrivibrio sp.]MBP3196327.1 DUF975 family protein [Butyrivibrio sp.]
MSNTSSAQLKAIAKEKSLDRYGTLIGANVLIFAIQVILSGITTISASGNFIILITNQIISIILNILLGVLVSGKAYLYMNLVYSQSTSAADIFFGLKLHPEKAVIIQSLFVVVDFIVSLPVALLLFFINESSSPSLIFTLIAIALIGIVINVYVQLTYSQAFFLLHDFPDRSAKELLHTSKKLMKGNRLRLLYVNLSYIPLYLLGLITLFIPLLWISVYRYATVTVFYQDLIAGTSSSNTQ